jgi:hypothetical protein
MGMVKDLIMLPGQIITTFESSFSFYEGLLTDIVTSSVDTAEAGGYQEAVAAFTLFGAAENVNVAEFTTREEALSAVGRLGSMYSTVMGYSDSLQTQFSTSLSGRPVLATNQFFGMLGVFDEVKAITLMATLKLMNQVYNVRAQRIIILDRPKTPIEIVINEYGSLGVGYSNLDRFIQINSLRGEEIELLLTGKEIVIYG